jgi:hypothetical protein
MTCSFSSTTSAEAAAEATLGDDSIVAETSLTITASFIGDASVVTDFIRDDDEGVSIRADTGPGFLVDVCGGGDTESDDGVVVAVTGSATTVTVSVGFTSDEG